MKRGVRCAYVREYSCDAGVTRRRVEQVCGEIEELIGPDASGVTVEVEGSRYGEIKARLEERGTIIIIVNSSNLKAAARTGASARTTVDGKVVVKRKGVVVGSVDARVVVVPVRELSCGSAVMSAVDFGSEVSVLWADRNLDVRTFRDGERISDARSTDEWGRALNIKKTPAWCHYDGDKGNCAKWGKLYFMPSVEELERLPPEGWRIPRFVEVVELLVAHGMERAADGDVVADEVKAMAAWKGLESGKFRGVLGGSRESSGGYVGGGSKSGWVVTGYSGGLGLLNVFCDDNSTGLSIGSARFESLSVRCVREKD